MAVSNYQYAPAISFDEQNQQGQFQLGLHATGWYYAPNYSNPDFWTNDDDGNGRYEEAKISFFPPNPAQNANVEVQFWDANWDGYNGWTKTAGKLNVSAYWVHSWLRYRVDSRYLGAFCFEQSDVFRNCT